MKVQIKNQKMRNLVFVSWGMVFGMLSLQGCENAVTGPEQAAVLQDGIWKISYYWDKDHEETNDFNSYTFVFDSDGTLMAVQQQNITSGTWIIDRSDDSHDHLIINFGLSSPLEELNDDWEIELIENNQIKLIDFSGSGGIENLHFVKS